MPTYEYKCNKCGHRFERFQSIMAGPIRKCPECGKNAVERLISAGGGLIFKGSGFYITDYRDSSYNDKAKADSASEKGEKTGEKSDKADATPAPAAEGKSSAGDAKADAKPGSKPEAAPAATGKSEGKSEGKSQSKGENKPAKSPPASESKPMAKSSSKKR